MKFFGQVGYGQKVETSQDVWTEQITEYPYKGDVDKDDLNLSDKDSVNPDLRVSQLISIVADAQARDNYYNIRYVLWRGVRWRVVSVSNEPPRLILRLGERYVGPEPEPEPTPPESPGGTP